MKRNFLPQIIYCIRKILHFVLLCLLSLCEILVCWKSEFGVFLFDVNELATALECQKQLLMLSISNFGGRESLEIAVKNMARNLIQHGRR